MIVHVVSCAETRVALLCHIAQCLLEKIGGVLLGPDIKTFLSAMHRSHMHAIKTERCI